MTASCKHPSSLLLSQLITAASSKGIVIIVWTASQPSSTLENNLVPFELATVIA